jgi:hypothetical protein
MEKEELKNYDEKEMLTNMREIKKKELTCPFNSRSSSPKDCT